MLDSGCTQHMTGDSKMFSSLEENAIGYKVIVISSLVTIAEAKLKELVKLLSQMITPSQMYC